MNRKRPRKKTILVAVLLLAGTVALTLYLRREKPLKVRVAKVEEVPELKALVNGSGEIRTEDSVDVQTEIAGVIVELPVKEGDRVKKGQVLLKIDPFQTESDVLAARSQLSALEAEAAGQSFQVASMVANAARDEFLKKSAEVEKRQAQTNLARAQMALNREKQLLADRLISPDQFEVTETTLTLNQATVEAAQAKIGQLDAQIKATLASIDFAKATRDAILKRVEGAKSSLLRQEDLLNKTTIRSTLDGVIVKLNVEVGERAVPGLLTNPQATLMTIADFSVIEAELKIDETDIVSVKMGDSAKVVVDAIPDTPLKGRVVEVGNSPILASTSGGGNSGQEGKDFKVVVRIEEPPDALRPGMSCEADITASVKTNVLVVPIQALTVREATVDASGQYLATTDGPAGAVLTATADSPRDRLRELQGVFVFAEDDRARFRPVKTGITGEMDIEVISGLSAGQEVIVGPLKALRTIKDNEWVERDLKQPYRRTLRKPAAEDETAGGGR